MPLVKDIAAFVLALGALGAGIDFLLSPAQKEAIKDWLLAKWVKFEDMKLSNFSLLGAGVPGSRSRSTPSASQRRSPPSSATTDKRKPMRRAELVGANQRAPRNT